MPAFGHYNSGQLLNDLSKSLLDVGYKGYSKVLNAINFSVPQNRKRLFIVGIRVDLDPGGFRFPTGIGTTNLDTILDPPRAGDSVSNFPDGAVAKRHVQAEQKRCDDLEQLEVEA